VAQVMSATQPPPVPGSHRPVLTYLGAILLTVPALALLIFSVIVHLPRLELLWRNAGLDGSRAQWLLDACRFVPNNLEFIFSGVLLLLILVELSWPGWRRWRRFVLFGAAFAVQMGVMLELAFVTTASQLAAGKVAKEKANP
jgi:hypothetical protein